MHEVGWTFHGRVDLIEDRPPKHSAEVDVEDVPEKEEMCNVALQLTERRAAGRSLYQIVQSVWHNHVLPHRYQNGWNPAGNELLVVVLFAIPLRVEICI